MLTTCPPPRPVVKFFLAANYVPGLVVMGGDSRSKGRGFERKRGRGWPIFKKNYVPNFGPQIAH